MNALAEIPGGEITLERATNLRAFFNRISESQENYGITPTSLPPEQQRLESLIDYVIAKAKIGEQAAEYYQRHRLAARDVEIRKEIVDDMSPICAEGRYQALRQWDATGNPDAFRRASIIGEGMLSRYAELDAAKTRFEDNDKLAAEHFDIYAHIYKDLAIEAAYADGIVINYPRD